ncbi:MAG: hypothetical protein KJ645_00875 [Planctomycetes bacterium]|nr:hypothetical protein [Planctomycetota bacterium]
MSSLYRYAHFHGFASSARSRKGLILAEAFAARGIELVLPDLNRPSFERITYTAALEGMDELDAQCDPRARWRISGSSMGGYLAARWAELNPHRVDRLALLCPGFQLGTRWPKLIGREAFEQWQRDGSVLLPNAVGEEVPVHWGLIEDSRLHPPFPEVPCPAMIFHGKGDETVPIGSSMSYAAARHDKVQLIEVDDDHHLMASIDGIGRRILTFYGVDKKDG